MYKLIREFFSENGTGSSKRLIVISIGIVLAWGLVFAMLRAVTDPARQTLVNSIMIFILVMSGVATIPQIVTLIRGGSPAKEEGNTLEKKEEEKKP